MVFKRFIIHSFIRIVILFLSLAVFTYLLLETDLVVTTVFIGFLALYQVGSIHQFVARTNNTLTRFLQSIEYSDFTQNYRSEFEDAGFRELAQEYEKVMQRFRGIRQEREESFQYLQTVIQHVGVGLIAYHTDGEVEMTNNAFRRLLQVPTPKNIRYLEKVSKELAECLVQIKSGENRLVKVALGGQRLLLSIYATTFILRQRNFRLVAVQDIHEEMEEQEMQAWHNLIRVLTHEIMNSITPISSLAATSNKLLNSRELDDEALNDLRDAAAAIERRSTGLIDFLEDYRRLTRIPIPKYELVDVKELFDQVKTLLDEELKTGKVALHSRVDTDSMKITADRNLIEQVLINLCKNAIQAVREVDEPEINLSAEISTGAVPLIRISDNGCGVSPDLMEKIFIPFFTTKPDGNGIGLSLSREIIRRHKGRLEVESEPGTGTAFSMWL